MIKSNICSGPYMGIHVRSNRIILPREFCERYIKTNKFVTPKWNSKEEMLELTFYSSNSDVSFRLPLTKNLSCRYSLLICSARFFAQLRQFKIGRYEVFDADITRSGDMTLKFKMEKNDA